MLLQGDSAQQRDAPQRMSDQCQMRYVLARLSVAGKEVLHGQQNKLGLQASAAETRQAAVSYSKKNNKGSTETLVPLSFLRPCCLSSPL